MGARHDPTSEDLALPSDDQTRAASDPLSDVLRTVRLTGALFFLVEASSPWSVDIPRASVIAPIILPRARHVISYHVVVEGEGWARIPGKSAVRFAGGDVLVFPHGDPYAMLSSLGTPALPPPRTPATLREEALDFFRAMAAGVLPYVVPEGGGGAEHARFACGFLGCDALPFNPLLSALPRLVHVPNGARQGLLDRLIELALAEARGRRPGTECIRLRLAELMFVEVVRGYLEALPAQENGWLAGLRDAGIGRVLALLHEQPARAWTLEELATEARLSRSVLAERFTRLVGQPPMQYLAHWRVQVAARLLADGASKVAAVALEVGYASEAAFSRSFKKVAGVSPAVWRARRS